MDIDVRDSKDPSDNIAVLTGKICEILNHEKENDIFNALISTIINVCTSYPNPREILLQFIKILHFISAKDNFDEIIAHGKKEETND